MPKCWNGRCIYNSNNSPKYKKCRREDYSRLQCRVDYLRKHKDVLGEDRYNSFLEWEKTEIKRKGGGQG